MTTKDDDMIDGVDDIGSLVTSIEQSTQTFWKSVCEISTGVDEIYRSSHGGQVLTSSELDRLAAALQTFTPVMIGVVVLAVMLACIVYVLMHLVAFLHHNPMFILLLLYVPECFSHRTKTGGRVFAY